MELVSLPTISTEIREGAILAALTTGTAIVAGVLLFRGATTKLEAVSFVTGAICVWLTVRESTWNFPIGLVNELAFLFVFTRARLYADAGLQIVYLVLTVIGWYLWLYGGAGGSELRITSASSVRRWRIAVAGAAMWFLMYFILRRVDDPAPGIDALTTSLSLCAQWLLDRKNLENWLLWIAADVIYIPLYTWRGLYLTAFLYAVFLFMAVIGLRSWLRTWQLPLGTTA